ncbi:MAG: hypothetical protein HRT35_34165, partial [Algicola sp.]|nr:hypothetical protein [Algicola sp.]
NGDVLHAITDGEIFWLQLDEPARGVHWVAYQQQQVVGYFAQTATQLVTGSDGLYSYSASQINKLAFSGVDAAAALVPTLTNTANGFIITDFTLADNLAGEALTLSDSTGKLIASQPVWYLQQQALFVARTAVPQGVAQLTLTRIEHSGRITTADLALNINDSTGVKAVTPASGSVISKGAMLPVTIEYQDAAMINSHSLSINGFDTPVGTFANIGAGWLLADALSPSFEWTANQSTQGLSQITLVDNDLEQGSVTLISPRNNQQFVEGDKVTVQYLIADDSGEVFNHAEITLLDFNGNVVLREMTNNTSGQLDLRLAALAEQDNYQLRVRGYYGAGYRFSESKVGIRVIPKRDQLSITLTGIGNQVMVGSDITLNIAGTIPAGSILSLQVTDEQSNIIAVGEQQLNFTVPALSVLKTGLVIKGSISDGYGNARAVEKTV